MSGTTEAEQAASAQLEGGAVCYRFRPSSGYMDDDTVEVFAGDYMIGSARLAPDRRHGGMLSARVPLANMPSMDLPATLRAVVPRTGEEVAPAMIIPDSLSLLRLVGHPRLHATLSSIRANEVTFDLELSTLPGYPRELVLHVTGAEVSRATSEPKDKKGNHVVTFATRSQLRDGDYVELLDVAADCPVHSMSITWMNLMEPLRMRLRQVESRLASTETYLSQMRGRMEALANVSRDRQLLERLDMFYALVNDRLDREIRWLEERALPAGAVPAVRPAATTRRLLPRAVEGVGIHSLESNGAVEWRWFGPRVMLVVRDVEPSLTGITLSFSSVGEGVTLADATISINGLRLDAEAQTHDGRSDLVMEAPPGLVRQDRSLLMHLEFATAFHPPGDSRALTAAFVEAELFYN